MTKTLARAPKASEAATDEGRGRDKVAASVPKGDAGGAAGPVRKGGRDRSGSARRGGRSHKRGDGQKGKSQNGKDATPVGGSVRKGGDKKKKGKRVNVKNVPEGKSSGITYILPDGQKVPDDVVSYIKPTSKVLFNRGRSMGVGGANRSRANRGSNGEEEEEGGGFWSKRDARSTSRGRGMILEDGAVCPLVEAKPLEVEDETPKSVSIPAGAVPAQNETRDEPAQSETRDEVEDKIDARLMMAEERNVEMKLVPRMKKL